MLNLCLIWFVLVGVSVFNEVLECFGSMCGDLMLNFVYFKLSVSFSNDTGQYVLI